MYKILLFPALLIAGVVCAQDNVKQMVDSLNTASNQSERIDLSRRIAIKLKNRDWERALTYIQYAVSEIEKTQKNNRLRAEVYVTAGKIYDAKDALDVTLEYFLKAYAIYDRLDEEEQSARLENNLAIIYARMNNKEEAYRYFQRVYAYQKSEGDSLHMAQVLNNLGTLYLQENPDSALYYYRRTLPIAESAGDTTLMIYLYTNMGRAYGSQNDTLAEKYFKRALDIAENVENTDDRAFVYTSYSQYNLNKKLYRKAVHYAHKSLESQKDEPFTFNAQDAAKTLYEANLQLENYREASSAFLHYDAIRDSLNLIDKAVNVERLKLEQDYRTRTKILKLNEQKARFKYYLIGLGMLVGILLLIIIVFRFRNRIAKNNLEKNLLKARQKELKHDLQLQNQAMISKAMAGMHQEDLINNVITDLKKIRLDLQKKSNQYAIDKVVNRLKRDLNEDTWQEFELSFQQVHNSFYTNLNAAHPDLTPKDRRLCALLYLDLSTKEISQITGQSFKSIENARTRLRKKLNLTNEKINLSTYLIGLE